MKERRTMKSIGITAIGVVVGAFLGWLYWFFIGCQNGMCTIKSDPLNMTLYGALMGGLVFDMLRGFWLKRVK